MMLVPATTADELAAKQRIEQLLGLPVTKHRGALPTPTLTATIVYDQGGQPGRVVIGSETRAIRLGERPKRRACHCSRCGAVGHSSKNPRCPKRGAQP
jgi:hypothetical protein